MDLESRTVTYQIQRNEAFYADNSSLEGEFHDLQREWIREEEDEWYLLPGTGFNVKLQVELLRKDLEEGLEKGESYEDIIEKWLQKTEQDIHGFKIEYLCEGLLFPIMLDKEVVNAEERIVAPLYGGKLFVDTVSEQERLGSVKKAIVGDPETGKEGIEHFLLTAHPGSVSVMTSPPGWSGFEGITYPDSQTYIWQIQEDRSIRGFTVRTDMEVKENIKLLETLGEDMSAMKGKNEQERLAGIVGTPVFLRGNDEKQWSIEDIVNAIRSVKHTKSAYKERGFDEIYDQLENPESLWTLDETTRKLVAEFRRYVWDQVYNGEGDREKNIQRALGMTVLELAKRIRRPKREEIAYDDEWVGEEYSLGGGLVSGDRYRDVLSDVQQLGGCNGGGGEGESMPDSYIVNSITPRIGVRNEVDYSKDPNLCRCSNSLPHFHCPGKKEGKPCKEKIIYGKGIKKCPSCGEGKKC